MSLLQQILTSQENCNLIIFGTFRDNEVDENHPLTKLIEKLRDLNLVNNMKLKPLELDSVNCLISDTLHKDKEKTEPLSKLVYAKTQGNPFFVIQFLRTLYNERLIYFDEVWNWDLKGMITMDVTDNIVDLLLNKIKKLPALLQKIISIAALIGNKFILKTIALVCNLTYEETWKALTLSVSEGLIVCLGEHYVCNENDVYVFAHDRVQQAASAMIQSDQIPQLRLQIGRILIKSTRVEDIDRHSFDIVSQFNSGSALITENAEKLMVAELNCRAARKALASAAANFGEEYAKIGIEMLPLNSWDDHYDFTFDLYNIYIECLYTLGKYAKSEELYPLMIEKARTKEKKIEIYGLAAKQLEFQGKLSEAIEISLRAINLLEFELPSAESEEQVKAVIENDLRSVLHTLDGRPPMWLAELPIMTDPKQLLLNQLLNDMQTLVYLAGYTNFYLCLALKVIKNSIQYGTSPATIQASLGYAAVASRFTHEYITVKGFADAAIKLLKQSKRSMLIGAACASLVASTVTFLTATERHEFAVEGFETGVEFGCLGSYASYCAGFLKLNLFVAGFPFSEVLSTSKPYMDTVQRYNNTVIACCEQFCQAIQDLSGNFEPDNAEKETNYLSTFGAASPFCMSSYKASKAITKYHLYDPCADWFTFATSTIPYLITYTKDILIETEGTFYCCLMLFAAWSFFTEAQKQAAKQIIDDIIKDYEKKCKVGKTLDIKYRLITAEVYRVFDGADVHKLTSLYEEAMKEARNQGCLAIEGLANELLAKYWYDRKSLKYSSLHFRDAGVIYTNWGAHAKVRYLEKKYPECWNVASGGTHITKTINSPQSLEVKTVLKVARAISKETSYEKFVSNLLKIALIHAGARRGALIIPKNSNLVIEAEASVSEAHQNNWDYKVLTSLPISSWTGGPLSLIQHVKRTKELYITGCAQDSDFNKDPYILRQQSKSILCVPIVNSSKLKAILYLENDSAMHVFTEDRVELLKLVSSQIGTSLENSILIKAQTEATEKIRIHAEEVKRYKKQLEEFIDVVCHEIRNPLNGIYGNVDILMSSVKECSRLVNNRSRKTSLNNTKTEENTIIIVDTNTETPTTNNSIDIILTDPGNNTKPRVSSLKTTITEEECNKESQGNMNSNDNKNQKEKEESVALENLREKEVLLNREQLHLLKFSLGYRSNSGILNYSGNSEESEGGSNNLSSPIGQYSSAIDKKTVAKVNEQIAMCREAIEALSECAHHQKVIVDDVLNLSKLEAGQMELNFEIKNLKKVIVQSVRMFDTVIQSKNLKFILELPSNDVELIIKTDSERLKQVLINLLSNAIKFTKEGSITTKVRAVNAFEDHSKTLNTYLEVSVHDTGPGMTEEERNRIFNRFSQANKSVSQQYGGSGLGLTISKKLVELMGGKISCQSEPGKGSTFLFTVLCHPISKDEDLNSYLLSKNLSFEEFDSVNASPELNDQRTQNITKEEQAEEEKKKRVVLIVEDNVINQKILKRHLETEGHQYLLAENGLVAVETVQQNEVDLILMDIEMPVMSGLEATKLIREWESQQGRTNQVPIIALSGNAREEQISSAMKIGLNDYITKPYERELLKAKIIKWTTTTN